MDKKHGQTTGAAARIAALCFGIQAVGIGAYVSFGVFFNPLMSTFGWPRAGISGASSVAFFISGLFAVYVGRISDRVGPKTIMTITAFFLGAGLMLMSGISALWQLYLVFGLIFGFGLSSVDVIALSTIARWFPEKRGFVTGMVKVGTGAGQMIFPAFASLLIAGVGWQKAGLILGFCCMVLLTLIARGLKNNPDYESEYPNVSGRSDTAATVQAGMDFSQAAKTYQLWLVCLINMIILSCLMSILVHIVPHARDMGFSAHKAAGVLSCIGGVSMLGRFATGLVIDRIGSRSSMMISLVVLVTGLLWLQAADTLWKLYLFASIYGLAHGGFFTVLSPIIAELFGTRAHGSLFGLLVFSGTAGGAIGPFMVGYLFDTSGSYALPFSLMVAAGLSGIGLLSLMRPISTGASG